MARQAATKTRVPMLMALDADRPEPLYRQLRAALTNAIADALNVRVEELPITPDRLMEILEKKESDDRKAAASKEGAPA